MRIHSISLLIATLASPAIAGPPSIERVAPEATFVSLWCPDAAGAVAAWEGTPMAKALDDPRLAASLGKARQAFLDRRTELAEGDAEMGKAVGLPGAIGAAVFAEEDVELDATRLAYFIYADFGDRADKAWDLCAKGLRKAATESKWTIDEEDLDGTPALVVQFPEDSDDGDFEAGRMEMLGQLVLPPESFVLTRHGSVLVGASAIHLAEDLMKELEAPSASGRLANSPGWKDAQGGLADSQLAVGVYFSEFAKLMQPMMAGPAAGSQGVIQALIGDVTAASIGLGVGSGERQIALRASIVHPGGPAGLFKLLEKPAPVTPATKAMGDDCVKYTTWNVNLAGFPRLLEEVLAAIPEDVADEVEPMIRGYMPALSKAFGAMGPRIESASRRDGAEEGGFSSLTRIACSDETAALPLIQLWGPMLGLQPQEFQGAQIFADSGNMMPVALGLGSTGLYLGSRAAVEAGLRASAATDAESLSATPGWVRATSVIGSGEFVGWGYVDTVAEFEASGEAMGGQMGMARQAGVADELAGDKTLEEIADSMKHIDYKALREFIGLTIYSVTQDRTSLRYEWAILTP